MTADDLRALRKRLGMTQWQLAKALGITPSTISNYEGARGDYEIPRVVELACEALAQKSRRRPTLF
jgi:transcriptional regulator with XRE-family HTH domain